MREPWRKLYMGVTDLAHILHTISTWCSIGHRSVAVITCALHAQGPQFEPGR